MTPVALGFGLYLPFIHLSDDVVTFKQNGNTERRFIDGLLRMI